MDVHLYEAGRQLLLDRQNSLRSAGRLQQLPQPKPHKRHHSQSSLHDKKGRVQSFGVGNNGGRLVNKA